jgi:hypothetical protein
MLRLMKPAVTASAQAAVKIRMRRVGMSPSSVSAKTIVVLYAAFIVPERDIGNSNVAFSQACGSSRSCANPADRSA